MCHPVPPSWASGRNPDCIVYSLGPNANEGTSKIFYVTLWSVEGPSQFQLRLWRRDTNTWAENQGITVYWIALWSR